MRRKLGRYSRNPGILYRNQQKLQLELAEVAICIGRSCNLSRQKSQLDLHTGGYKEMPFIVADQERPRIRAQMRREEGSCGSQLMSTAVHRNPNKVWRL
jgi:hypothetical protein